MRIPLFDRFSFFIGQDALEAGGSIVGLQHKCVYYNYWPSLYLLSQPLPLLLFLTCICLFCPLSSSFLPLFFLLIFPPRRSPCSPHRGYLVAAPSVFRAGVEESVSVTIFNAKAETRVQVQLTVKGQAVAHSHGSLLGENKAKVTPAQCITFREENVR